jgi:Fe-S cluster assembly ATP-binding protein
VLAITHFTSLLSELRADRVHVLSKGRIVASGGAELADQLERTGYTGYVVDEGDGAAASARAADPFADPFADPLG